MSPDINRTGLMLILSVIVLGVFALVLLEYNTRTRSEKIGDSVTDIINEAGENLENFRDDIADKIEDAGDKK